MKRLSFALAAVVCFGASAFGEMPQSTSRIPEEVLKRISSGGLLRLDQNGDLVRPPRQFLAAEQIAPTQTSAAATVALDPRVGGDIRLGDDPAALQSAQCTSCNPRAQAEPHIMRSRTDLDFVVAAFQEGRFTNGGALDCGYSATHDGGLTWTRNLLPGVTQLTGGPYFRATDPVAGIDLNNYAYINMDAGTDPTFDHGDIIVSRSTDRGASFEPYVLVYHPNNTNYFADKNWMAVNTFAGAPFANRILVTWTLFTEASNPNGPCPLVASYSDDAGQSWSTAQFITPTTSQMQGSQPLFLPNGNVVVVYWNFVQSRIESIMSTDGGATFGPVHPLGTINQWEEPSIRTGSFLPSATTDRTTNDVYAVIQANLGTVAAPIPKVLFSKSTDGGNTWTPYVAISDNPNGSGVFNPAITASPDGQTLTVAFYDRRNNPNSTTLVDLYEAQSFDGGATWQPNIRLTNVSTDVTLAPNTGSTTSPAYMIGDYLGVAEPTNRNVPAVPVYIDSRNGNPDPFVTRIGMAPQFDFRSWQAARLSYAQIQAPQYGLRQLNISTRALVATGENALIGGFIITGAEPKDVLIRGLGPSLSSQVISNYLFDPVLELHDASGALIASNDNWQDSQAAEIQQTGIPPSQPQEAAIRRTLSPGNYTAVLTGKNGTTGIGLVELYDLNSGVSSQFGNISTRGFVADENDAMIGGFIIGGGNGPNGTGSAKIAVRALGPSLSARGVTNPVQDPTLELHDGNGTAILFNDNWKDSQQADIQNVGLAPSDDRESALVALVPPGNYTAVVRAKNHTSGVGLVEAYNLP